MNFGRKPKNNNNLSRTGRRTGGPRHRAGAAQAKKRRILYSVMALSLVGIITGGTLIGCELARRERDRAAYENLQQEVVATAAPTPTQAAAPPSSSPAPTPTTEPTWQQTYARQADKQIDFEALQEINPLVYAWIEVEGTDIAYPILHTEKDDWTYLDHDIYGNKSAAGAIYTDGWNAGDFSDPNTLIYGHNMRDKSMFAQLRNFQQKSFFDEHDEVRIYFPDGRMYVYSVFAAYIGPDLHILAVNDFHDEAVYSDYLSKIPDTTDKNAHFRDRGLTAQDRILSMITCVGSDQRRLFVQAALVAAD